MAEPVEIVASPSELEPYGRVWGTGGWLQPECREALDWATFARLLGWGIQISTDSLSSRSRWIIIARPPDEIDEDMVRQLWSRLSSEHILVVARAARPGDPLERVAGVASAPGIVVGSSLEWIAPGANCHWLCRKPFSADALSLSWSASVWATLDGIPIIAARRVGPGVIATLAFHPSSARDQNGAATALLRNLLVRGTEEPVAWLDFEDTLILRMDDPGGAQNIYSKSWSYPKLGESAWQEIGSELRKRNGRLSIGYVAGWVDDGEPERGLLRIDGESVGRIPGAVHPSPLVTYQERDGWSHDYVSEFRGIEGLRSEALAEVELHGYTHIHRDRTAWLEAPDRYESVAWYRELGSPSVGPHPLDSGLAALQRWFHTRPSTLICPGDQWTDDALERAMDLGFELVSSYYLGIRDSNRLLWATHVCAPYLDQPDPVWFDAGLPVVGYFHDRELSLEGTGWMSRCLDGWKTAGARRLLDLRELAAALSRRIVFEKDSQCLRVTTAGPMRFVRPVVLGIYVPPTMANPELPVALQAGSLSLSIHVNSTGFSRVTLTEDL